MKYSKAFLVWFHRLKQWEYFGLFVLVLVSLILHFSIIMQPGELVFDEKHYVPDARQILAGEGTMRIEHPPMGKLFIAFGIAILGDNPFGWRFLPVVFGTLIIVFFYLTCRELGMTAKATLVATTLLVFENLSFIMSSVAMLDVFSLAFTLFSFWLCVKQKLWLSGLAAGLSTLCKLSGALTAPVLFLYWFFTGRKNLKTFLGAMLLSVMVFLLLIPVSSLIIWHKLTNPIAEIKLMLYAISLDTFTSNPSEIFSSRPWEWLLKPEIITFWPEPHYICMISPVLLLLVFPVLAYMIYQTRKGNQATLFGLIWFAGTYLVWIPISIIADRMSYVYYFYPTVGALCIGLGLTFDRISAISKTTKSNLISCDIKYANVAHFFLRIP